MNFCDYAIKIVKTLLDISEGKKIEYQGYIFAIYSLVRTQTEQPAVVLLQIRENTDLLITGLKNLNSNIKRYIDELTRHSTVSEIMDALFNDYITNIVDKAYHRLLTSDNVSKFRPEILERLESRGQDILSKLRLTENATAICKDEIEKIKKNSTVIEKQIRMEELEAERKKIDGEIGAGNRHLGNSEEKISTAVEQQKNLDSSKKLQSAVVEEILCKAQENSQIWIQDYRKLSEQRSPIQLKENYSRQQKANETSRSNAENAMKEEMVSYKMSYDFGASATVAGYPEFMDVYDRLKNSELLTYEEKVQKARTAAEEEFREQFLSKLQENMKQAQSEFKELNKALKDIPFSNEMYEFLYLPSKRYDKYYRMIMDDFNVMQGESIFTGLFHETHKDVIDELFERLALDTENTAKTLDEFTDYRTYMDYDIRIIHSDGNYYLYSKVCEEKSGGETQTPFYVTVAASFVQLYRNNIGGEAIGLVMFDEAFNNMDNERIGGVLEFLNRLPHQIRFSTSGRRWSERCLC